MSFLDQQFKEKVDSYFISKELFVSYNKILEEYWQRDTTKAINMLTKEIEALEGSEASSLYYRLWIEILAEQGDKYSLAALQKHFINLKKSSDMNQETLRALRGLIHLELDEIKLCEHLSKLVANNLENPYCLEFYQRYQSRFVPDQKDMLFLLMTKTPLVDYFHWQYLAKSLLVKGKFNLLNKCLDYISKSFAKTPLEKEFEVYKLLDSHEFSAAEDVAYQLTKSYRNNTHYNFLYAYLLSCNQKYKESNKILSSLVKKHKEEDGDIFSLLGYNSYLLSYGDINSSNWENAINYLLKAEALLSKEGLPTKEVSLNLTMIDKRQREVLQETEVTRESYNYWLVNLTAESSHSFLKSEEGEGNQYLFCNLGSTSREGDLLFFMSTQNHEKSPRLFSLYTVLSTPIWNSLEKYQTPVKKIYTMQCPADLPKNLREEKSNLLIAKKQQNHTLPKGTYLLSDKGIKSLGKAILKEIEAKELPAELKETLNLKKAKAS